MENECYTEMRGHEDIHWWFVARRTIIKKVLDSYVGDNIEGKILEVGCGSGGNLKMLNAYGNISAMEVDDQAREMANNRKICHVKKGMLPSDIPFENGFDLICILDVLEHIEDDLSALKTIRDKLNPNGNILITVPAYKFLWSSHDVVMHHKRRYTKKQLTRLVSKAELKIKYSTYFNSFLFPLILMVRFLNNFIGKNNRSDVELPSTLVNYFLTIIFSSERALLPVISFPFGVSILLIAKNAEDDKG